MKRILLFLATNLAVVVVLGIVANLLGVNRFLTGSGLNISALLGFAAVMGFGGAFISLLISKTDCQVEYRRTGHRASEQFHRALARRLRRAAIQGGWHRHAGGGNL